jgi:drug/metabolite transporter (DMT)-like permease
MPVPDALCIIFACPVITILLSAAILGDKLNSLKCFAGSLLLIGVVLVCQPPFLFPQTQDNQVISSFLLSSHTGLYYVGVALAGTSCCTGGLMNVLIAKCQVGVNILDS